MTEKRISRRLFWGTALAALVLQTFEWPYALALVCPLFVPAVLAYWALIGPQQPTGLLAAWCLGLLLDVMVNSVLGQHALGLVLVVFFVRQMRGFLSLVPVWQVGLVLLPLWLGYEVLMFWVDGVTEHHADPWLRWLPSVVTALLWPLITGVLATLRRRDMEDPARL